MNSQTELLELYKESRTKCLIFSRTMGYYRPVSFMNTGKQSEFKQRVFYSKDYFPKQN